MTYARTDYEWFVIYANLYFRYISAYKKLEDCYDQMLHPQKRKLVKNMLENTMVRLCEIKNVSIEYSHI